MAQVIQFPCPVCASTLRLPFELGGRRGPCPSCGHEIVAPDPLRGIPAHLPAPPQEQVPVVREFRPFQESLPMVPPPARVEAPTYEPFASDAPAMDADARAIEVDVPAAESVPSTPILQAPQSEAGAACPHRAAFLPALILTAVISLAAGYLAGSRPGLGPARIVPAEPSSPQPAAKSPDSVPSVVDSNRPAAASAPVQAPVLVKPAIQSPEVPAAPHAEPVPPKEEPKPVPAPAAEPKKASAMAEAALRAFLEAPDWSTRAAHVLFPEKLRAAMEAYSRNAPDGPTPFVSLSVENSYTDKQSGSTLFIFKVVTESLPTGFPVAVSETRNGWNVDWKTFVEFRDDHFRKFADGPADKTGRFHLIASAPPADRAAGTENEHFSSILLDPPLPGRQRMAYVRKSTELHTKLKAATAEGAIFTPVLELAKRSTPDGRSYLEVVSIAATDWLPTEP